ncbi:TPA_asm: pyocin [Salmonella enterica subsp. enterica serovar Java]|nr:pyocin [Salmonella enterica]EGZ3914670.1 pyocin [Salmonella enterica subsp. enterica serovar Java]HAC6881545.1 pyocin [Salmonella enterica subsp. enterica serovar Java]
MGYRTDNYGRGQAFENDKTTTGARCIASINDSEFDRRIVRVGDMTTPCPKCGEPGRIINGESRVEFFGKAVAMDGSEVSCGCPRGTNRVIAPAGQWMGRGRDPVDIAREEHAARVIAGQEAEEKRLAEERDRNRVFAKSCLRGEGCNDAGEEQEPHTNFAAMAFYQAVPPADPASDTDVTQHAQTAKKKKPVDDIPKPKKRSALYKWLKGDHEEIEYQRATAAATSAANAQTAVEGASVLGLVGGNAITSGTWAVKLGEMATGIGRIAASGPGAPIAAVVLGMMPGRLNDGEQDFIDRMRLEQMREAPSRVRYTWEQDDKGNLVPHGWHTPPGKDMVRVRKMEWDSSRKAYTFTTEEDPRITIIWTPDSSGVNVPSNTGNQNPVRIPNPVVVDPLPENTSIEATTTPAPEEKNFADYILVLPLPNIPPIYIYLSKPPVEFLEVELYSDFVRRSRQGKYEADHMPSKAAVKAYLKAHYPEMTPEDIELASQDVAAIVIPKKVHQKISETYGGRNTSAQIELDSKNLRAALDRNLDAIKPALKEQGATENQIESARSKMHKLNSEMGLYK